MILSFSFSYVIYKTLRTVHRITSGKAATVPSIGNVSLIGVFTDHHVIVIRNKG